MATSQVPPEFPEGLMLERASDEVRVTVHGWNRFCQWHGRRHSPDPPKDVDYRPQAFYATAIKESFMRAEFLRTRSYFGKNTGMTRGVLSDIYLDPVLRLKFVVASEWPRVITVIPDRPKVRRRRQSAKRRCRRMQFARSDQLETEAQMEREHRREDRKLKAIQRQIADLKARRRRKSEAA